jgi:lipoprotein signal peptidase
VNLLDVHAAFAWVVVISNALVGLWALGAHWLPALRHRSLWWATLVAELTIVAQVVLGVLLVTNEEREVPQFHMFYGFVALASVGIIYSYRQQLKAWLYLLYGLGGLFLMGLAIRAMTIGPNR